MKLRKKILILFPITALFLVLTVWLVSKYPSPIPFKNIHGDKAILIAHAGGGIDGASYTNSEEAVLNSLTSGFNFIELDLLMTCDGYLIAAHDWPYFHDITGSPDLKNCLSLYEAKARRIYDKYTVLDVHGINQIFSAHEGAYLVTDKIRDYDSLINQLQIPVDRLIVEVFSYKGYTRALRRGIKYPVLCLWSTKEFKRQSRKLFFNRIAMISICVEMIEELEEELTELYENGVAIFAFAKEDIGYKNVNDAEFVSQYINKCVTGFYTDFLPAASAENIATNANE